MLLATKYLFPPHYHDFQTTLKDFSINLKVNRIQQYLAQWCLFSVDTVNSYTCFVISEVAPYFKQNHCHSYINRQGTVSVVHSPAVGTQEDGRHGRSKR